MSMTIHEVSQGTPEWHALRAEYFTASEAPAMLGVSKYQTRTELLQLKKTGLAPEVGAAQQRLFDNGHATEALARPIIERLIGEDLYPVVGTLGNLLASMDGMTMLGDTLFEHKALNQSLVEQIKITGLDPHYWAQLEQQLYVSGAERVIFVCSDGTEENLHWMEYRAVPGRIEQILAGWKQFEEDLAAFEAVAEVPKVTANAVSDLPAVTVTVSGSIALVDNFATFEAALTDFLANKLIREPRTDQDFADLDLQIKALKKAESALDAAEQQMLAQVETVDTAKRKKDALAKLTRDNRLLAEKLLSAKKDAIRLEIKQGAERALAAHIETINKRLGKVRLPIIPADFAGAIKGKRTISSLQDACDTELARAKIEANAVAESIETNLASLRELAGSHAFLFSDAQQLVLKESGDLVAIIKTRIAEHEKAEEVRREAEREQIREQERQRLEAEQTAKEKAEAVPIEQPAPDAQPKESTVTPIFTESTELPAIDDGQRIKLGDINGRLGFNLTADFLRSIGFEPVGRERAAVLYRADDFPRICSALIAHIQSVGLRQNAA